MIAMLKKLRAGADKGFTLIELLIVVSILGVLSAIVVFSVNSARTTAIAKACQTSATTLVAALDQYKAQNATTSYPTLANVPTALVSDYIRKMPALVGDGGTQDYFLKINGLATSQVSVAGYTDSAATNAIAGCTA